MKKKLIVFTLALAMMTSLTTGAFAEQAREEMKIGQAFSLEGIAFPENTILADKQMIDVNKDGVLDTVYLIGTKEDPKSAYVQNINLIVQDGKTEKIMDSKIIGLDGYDPYIKFAGDFNGDKANDILIQADMGGSGGWIVNRIVSFYNNTPKLILSDNLRIKGELAEFNELEPWDTNGNGVYELVGLQRLVGKTNADTLGYVQTTLSYKNGEFQVTKQTKTKKMPGAIIRSAQGDFQYITPAVWDGKVKVEKLDEAQLAMLKQPGKSSERILYTPVQADSKGKKVPQVVLSITKYDKDEWKNIAEERNKGIVLGERNKIVYVLETPQSNPFADKSKDAKIFDDLISYLPTFQHQFSLLEVKAPYIKKTIALTTKTKVYRTTTGKSIGSLEPQKVTVTNEKQDAKGRVWYQTQDKKLGTVWFPFSK